jgi:hypothetical protein
MFLCSPVGIVVSPVAGAFGAHFASRFADRLGLGRARWLVTAVCIVLLGILAGVLPWIIVGALYSMGLI